MKKKQQGPTLFTFLNQIYMKNEIFPYDKKIASAYMISMWLSHDKELIRYVEKIIPYQFTIPDEYIYRYYMSVIPKKKRYINWIKKTPEQKDFIKKVSKIVEETDLSKREAKMLVNLKNKLGIKEVKSNGKNKRRKLKKSVKKSYDQFFN